MYAKNVKSEGILSEFCALDSEVFCDMLTKFCSKILCDNIVNQFVNVNDKIYWFPVQHYLGTCSDDVFDAVVQTINTVFSRR